MFRIAIFCLATIGFACQTSVCVRGDSLTSSKIEAMQDRIDRRQREIAALVAYSTRLQGILQRAGFPSGDLLPEQTAGIVAATGKGDQRVTTFAFDVGALLSRNPNRQDAEYSLMMLVTDNIAPDSWRDAGGEIGALRISGDKLIVTQTKANLAEISTFLEELDLHKKLAHQRALIREQQRQIVALTVQNEKLAARCQSLGIEVPPQLDQAMSRVVQDLEFSASPLANCFKALADASGQIMHIDWNALHEAGIEGSTPITLSLRGQTFEAALRSLMERASVGKSPLQYVRKDNAVTISTQEEFDKITITRVYDIEPFLRRQPGHAAEAANWLLHTITTEFDPDSWRDAGGSYGNLRQFEGSLIVTHNERIQARIKEFLERLDREPQ